MPANALPLVAVSVSHLARAFSGHRESPMGVPLHVPLRVPFRSPAALMSLVLLCVLGATALSACSPGATSDCGSASRGRAVTLVPSPKWPWIEYFNPLISQDNSLARTHCMIYETP